MKSLLMVFLIIWVSSSSSTHSFRGSLNGFSQHLETQTQATPKVQHPKSSHTQCQTTHKVQPNTQCQATPNVQHPMPSYTQCPTPNAKPHPISNTQGQTTPKVQHPMLSHTQYPTPKAKLHPRSNTQCQDTPNVQHPMS